MKKTNFINQNQKEKVRMIPSNDNSSGGEVPKKKKKPSNAKKRTPREKPLDKAYMEYIEQILMDSLEEAIIEENKVRKLDNKTLTSIMEEYLSAFIVIGYDCNNEPVIIMNAKNQMQADGIATLVNKLIMNANKNGLE